MSALPASYPVLDAHRAELGSIIARSATRRARSLQWLIAARREAAKARAARPAASPEDDDFAFLRRLREAGL